MENNIIINGNDSLHNAKREKNDEFYTKRADIEKELQHYLPYLKGKRIICPCDTTDSEFVKYFMEKGKEIGILSIAWSHISTGTDFRDVDYSNYDVVVTNPPFSLFREFIATLEENHMDYLVIGNKNAITYKEIFPLLQYNKMWLGVNNVTTFTKPDGTEQKFGNIGWFTNIPHHKRNEFIPLTKSYKEEDYLEYDNYDAIDISKVADIPKDYNGYMGVPITFLDKYNPEQFDIIKFRKGNDGKDLCVNGKCPYFRIIIKKKRTDDYKHEYRDFLEGLEKENLLYMYLVSLISADSLLTLEDCYTSLKEIDFCLEVLPENNIKDKEKIKEMLIQGKEIVNKEIENIRNNK